MMNRQWGTQKDGNRPNFAIYTTLEVRIRKEEA